MVVFPPGADVRGAENVLDTHSREIIAAAII